MLAGEGFAIVRPTTIDPSELRKLALEQTAPEELVLFDETAAEYFRDPEATLRSGKHEEAVGFGLELGMLTPFLLAIATPVVHMLVSLVEHSVEEELKPTVAQLVHSLFRRAGSAADATAAGPPVELTIDELRRVRATAYEHGIGLGLDESRAGLLADSVAGGLVAEQP